MELESRSLTNPRVATICTIPRDSQGMERRGQPPHSAPLSAASGPATRKRPIAVLTLQGSPGEGALVIAGTSWEAKGRGLQADRPLRGADTSPPRLREQLGKFSGAGKPQKRRECDATSPTPVRVGQSNPRQWELFPLSLPAPRCSHGAGRLRLGRCMNPRLLLASSPPPAPQPPNLRVPAPARALWLLGAPTPLWGRISSRPHPPHFPLCRPLPTRLRRSLPSPRPGKAEGCGGRGSRQPTPGWEGMGVVCGSSIGSGRARGREGGLMGRGRGVDSRCGGGQRRAGTREGRGAGRREERRARGASRGARDPGGRLAGGRGARAGGSSHFLAPLALAVQLPLQALRAVLRLVRLLLQRLDLAFHRLQGVEAGHGKEARGRTQRALDLARIGFGEAAAAAPQPPSLCLRRCRPRSSLPRARPPSGR